MGRSIAEIRISSRSHDTNNIPKLDLPIRRQSRTNRHPKSIQTQHLCRLIQKIRKINPSKFITSR